MPTRADRPARLLVLAVGMLLVAAVALPPFVGEGARGVLMAAFSGVCHQLPARSPHWSGVPFAVCFRCFGIYWGLPLAAIAFPVLHRMLKRLDRRAPLVLAASLVPAGVDWILEVLGLVPGSQSIRLLTGLLFGVAAGYYLVAALARSRGRAGDPK